MKYVLMIIGLFLLVGSFGCADGGKIKVSENTSNLKPNIPYSIRSNMSIAIKKSYIAEKLGKADITRKLETKTYEIRKKNDGSMVIFIYDNENKNLIDVWRLKELFERNDFKNIVAGESTYDDVVQVDPYTIVFENSNKEGISEHRMMDDEVAVISYKREQGTWRVYDISFEKDPLGFSTLISPDYKKLDLW